MIVIGYQGIGKSTLARKSFRYIDLESSALRKGNMRWQNWYEPYCMIAEWLSRQGYTVFVSSHKEVRDYLNEFCEEPFCAVVPSEDIKDEWIERLRERHKRLPTDKNYRAYINAVDRFTENVRGIKKDVADVREITSMSYELDKLIEKADTPQTESTGSPIGDYRDGVGAWQTERMTEEEIDTMLAKALVGQTDCGWGEPK